MLPSEAIATVLPAPLKRHWLAQLQLRLKRSGTTTYIAHRRHEGPLVVQRPFREPSGACQVYILHPPGGVVGGDEIRLLVELEQGAELLITTPAATKLYRSPGAISKLVQQFDVHAGARLEWLPQETIAYNGLNCVASTRVALRGDAQFIGCEVLCLGEDNRGLARGQLTQSWDVTRDGELIWCERAQYAAGDSALTQAWGLAGKTVVGTLICTGATAEALDRARQALAMQPADQFSVTRMREVLVVRFLGSEAQMALDGLRGAWEVLRPLVMGRSATVPRVWAT